MQADPPALSLQHVTRRFGAVLALDGLSVDIARGEIVCLVGHSGCGKSTLLRIIAGVEPLDEGRLVLDGVQVAGEGTFVEPENRRVGFMFQDYALFPHLSVRQNIGFGLKRLARAERAARVDETIGRIGIAHLADRYPHMLSGGEQQRVALARALAPRPRVVLMDEPFSNLDRGLRDGVRRETLDIIRTLGITAIVVTHDPEEALAIGDRVALMEKGRLLEINTGDVIFNQPRTAYAAAFFSEVNRLPGSLEGNTVSTALGTFAAPADVDGALEVLIRPHDLTIAHAGISAVVQRRVMLGEIEELLLRIDGHKEHLVMRGTTRHAVQVGHEVRLKVNAAGVMVFPLQSNN
jgi:iron(III) transport system ATP-binding protein